jgi:hypothetical protein
MATYYIDPDNGSDVTGDGTEANPYRKGPSQSGAVVPNALGNTYLFKRGTVMSEGLDGTFSGNAANEGQRVVYGAYGNADNPPRIDVAGAAAYCIRVQNKDYVSVRDFDLYNASNTGLQILNNTTRACKYFKAARVRAYDCASDGISMTHPGNSTGVSPAPAIGVVLDGCEGYRNGQHGVAIIAYASGAILKNCYGTGNSLTSSGWGVYHGGWGITYIGTSGWSISGNVKSRTVATAAKPYGVISGNTVAGAYHLTENTDTPTTPDVGEWGYSGTTVYVNIGVIAAGYSIALIYQPNNDAVMMDCRGDSQLLFDGVGLGMDRGVYRGRILRCRGSDNAGSAVQVNQAVDIDVDSVIGTGNREAVYMSSIGGVCSVSGVTSDDLTYGIRAERVYTGLTLTLSNNLLLAPIALYAATIDGTVSANYNAYTGSLSGVSAGANDITADPLLTDTYRPKPGSPLLGAGTHLGYTRDIDRKQRPNPPSIGAYDVATLRTPE